MRLEMDDLKLERKVLKAQVKMLEGKVEFLEKMLDKSVEENVALAQQLMEKDRGLLGQAIQLCYQGFANLPEGLRDAYMEKAKEIEMEANA